MSSNSKSHEHPDYATELPRLNRLIGQMSGVKRMIEQRRYCLDIITQLTAIQKATKSLSANILRRHLESCVRDAVMGNDAEQASAKIE